MPAPPIINNRVASRFECTVEGHRCVADYELRPQERVIRMTHTGVHPSLRGRGIAAALVDAALAYARSEGLRVDPVCSYVQDYLQRHPGAAELAPGA